MSPKRKIAFSGVLFLFIVLSSGFIEKTTAPTPVEMTARVLVDQLLKSIENTKTLRYNLKLSERIEGKMLNTESSVKLQISPRKLYLYLKGPELLWVQGQNNGNALVNPSSFPYFNLNLNPYGSLMRKNQHHTIHEMGYEYFANVLRNTIKKAGDKFEKYFICTGEEIWDGRPCYKLVINYPEFAFNNYTVQKAEDLISISRKLFVSEYMILENNPYVKDYNDVKQGQQIKVPNAYAKLTTMMIDKQFFLPINNKILDDKGLYESYEYHNLQANPKIADEEFTRYFKEYNF